MYGVQLFFFFFLLAQPRVQIFNSKTAPNPPSCPCLLANLGRGMHMSLGNELACTNADGRVCVRSLKQTFQLTVPTACLVGLDQSTKIMALDVTSPTQLEPIQVTA